MSLQCELSLSNLGINLSNTLFLRFNIFNFSNYTRCLVKKWGIIPRKGIKGRKNHIYGSAQFSSVQSLSCVWLFATPWTAAYQASLFITNSRSLLRLMSIELVMPSNMAKSDIFTFCWTFFLHIYQSLLFCFLNSV